jgi:hypothetical protein
MCEVPTIHHSSFLLNRKARCPMKHLCRNAWCLFSLALLFLVLGTPLKSHAATRTPSLPHAPHTCDLRNNAYPTNYAYPTQYSTYPTEYTGFADPSGPDYLPVYSGREIVNSDIQVGAWTCGSTFLELIAFPSLTASIVPDTYLVYLTVNGMSTVTRVPSSAFSPPIDQGLPTTELTVQAHQVYTIDVVACQNDFCEGAVELP